MASSVISLPPCSSCQSFPHLPICRILIYICFVFLFFFSSRRRHTRCLSDWSSDVCSSDLRSLLECFRPHPNALFRFSDLRGRHFRRERGVEGSILRSPLVRCTRLSDFDRSEERRVGKECRSQWSTYH